MLWGRLDTRSETKRQPTNCYTKGITTREGSKLVNLMDLADEYFEFEVYN